MATMVTTLIDSNTIWAKKLLKKGLHLTKNRVHGAHGQPVDYGYGWLCTQPLLLVPVKNVVQPFFLLFISFFWQSAGGVTMTLLEQNPSIMPIIWRRYSVFQTHEAAAKTAAADELLCLKNAGTQMFFTYTKWSEYRKIQRKVILGDVGSTI